MCEPSRMKWAIASLTGAAHNLPYSHALFNDASMRLGMPLRSFFLSSTRKIYMLCIAAFVT
jgi:hypothetical protein